MGKKDTIISEFNNSIVTGFGKDRKLFISTGIAAWIVTLILLTLIPSTVGAQDRFLMPRWFWNPPQVHGVRLAAGYSDLYVTPEKSYAAAFNDAAMRLWRDRECRIISEKGMLEMHGVQRSAGSELKIEADTAGFASFAKTLQRVDSVQVEGMVVMLTGTRKIPVDGELTPSPELPQVRDLANDNVFTAMGVAAKYWRESSSWIEAEQVARQELAFAIQSRISVLERQENTRRQGVLVTRTDVVMRGVRTIARAVDPVTRQRRVIVQVDRNAVAVPVDSTRVDSTTDGDTSQ